MKNCDLKPNEPIVKDILVVGDVIQYVLKYEIENVAEEVSRSLGGAFFVQKLVSSALEEYGIKVHTYLQDESEANYLELRWNVDYFKNNKIKGQSVIRYKDALTRYNNIEARFKIDKNCPSNPKLNIENNSFQILIIEDLGLVHKNVNLHDNSFSDHPFSKRRQNSNKTELELEYVLSKMSLPEEILEQESDFPQIVLIINQKLPDFNDKNNIWSLLLDKYQDKTLVIIDSGLLISEGLKISQGISWERTSQDYLFELCTDSRLKELKKFQHLVVRFGLSGVIHSYWIGKKSSEKRHIRHFHRLFFDPKAPRLGTYRQISSDGTISGNQTILAASVIREIIKYINYRNENCFNAYAISERIGDGIRRAIRLCQKHFDEGLGTNIDSAKNFMSSGGFSQTLFKLSDSSISAYTIADERIPVGNPSWSILNQSAEYNLLSVAKNIVIKGINGALNNPNSENEKVVWTPIIQFGEEPVLTVLDRRELESYSAVYRLISNTINSDSGRPLSIAVFGPPGSGKSFVVKKLAQSVGLGDKIKSKTFNLTQFTDPNQLKNSIDSLEEIIKEDRIPLVFFDEFDTEMNGIELGWLKYFLPYMEDWQFKPPSGKGNPIFVFAGGTSHTYSDFTREDQSISEKQKADFVMKKGPDFVSRLRGHINILGPNPVDEYDQTYVIRRALLIRNFILSSLPKNNINQTNNIEDIQLNSGIVSPQIISAMLEVSTYKHGARSMRAIIEMMDKLSEIGGYVIAALPTIPQLNMHVDAKEFMKKIEGF